ncbi:hypothetical protein [Catenulispora subtropica]|uniref:PknH-like extracellular domain-containing protein n=1 Tax=Catenulispora subtropica TaxID=450798 RepID=A0ABP5CXZ6_9ACTN
MSEFVDVLTEAVEAGTAEGRLPGAADAMRRGRRRSLRARGGAAALGVAVLGGALGIGSTFGPDSGTTPVGAGAGPGEWGVRHADDGILPVAQWPGDALAHWKLTPSCGLADRKACRPGAATDDVKEARVGEWTGQCEPGASVPVRRFVQYGTQFDEGRKLDADEIVFTFPDRDTAAAAFLAGARTAGSPQSCAGVADAEVASPGVSTADGVSWLLTQKATLVGYTHFYVVQVDDRVALLRVNQIGGDTLRSTTGDETVLQNLKAALSR